MKNPHIFASSVHIAMIFTYTEMPSSPLSCYVHYILLCYRCSNPCSTCVALLMQALTNLPRSFLLPTSHIQQCTGDAAQAVFFDLRRLCNTLNALLAVWDGFSGFFFRCFRESCDTMFSQLKLQYPAATMRHIHDR